MSTQVNAMVEEAGLDPFESEALATFLTSLESLVDESAPVPAPALARMLAGGPTRGGAAVVRLAARRHRNALAAAALAVSGIVATGVAAAANDLPTTAQRVVAEFSQRFLPFDFPHPEERSEGLVRQNGHLSGQHHDPDAAGGPSAGADDGGAQAGGHDGGPEHPQSVVDSSDLRDTDEESGGVGPESQSQDEESGTQTNTGSGDNRDEDGDSEESSSGESDDQTEDTTAIEDTTTGDDFDGGTGDTSGESGGDDAEHEDETPDSTEAIDD